MNTKVMVILGTIILIIGGYFYFFGNNQELSKKDRDFMVNFVKEHNASVENLDIEEDDFENDGEILPKLFLVEKNEGEIEEKEIVKKIVPYTEFLPEMPDEAENNSTLYGVDSNGNGVRDDLEIETVNFVKEKYGGNKEIVEAIFAGIRGQNYAMYIVENYTDKNEKIEHAYIMEIWDNSTKSNFCAEFYFNDAEKIVKSNIVKRNYYNSEQRIKYNSIINSRIGGTTDFIPTHEKCQKFFEKSKEYIYN